MKTKPCVLGLFLVAGLVPAQAVQFGDSQHPSSGTHVTITRQAGADGEWTVLETRNGLTVRGMCGFWGRRTRATPGWSVRRTSASPAAA
ncbi:MAG: hypothetical protein HS113_30550 [Verrucomicrobiales bacterium]|nr:hypothetical protein [Verrucomicrobiales bacterium]